MFQEYRADFLSDQLLIKTKFFIAKMRKKNFRWKKNLFASQSTFSDASRQSQLKYIIPHQRKSFLHHVKSLLRHVHYHKHVKCDTRTSVVCMILVMDMNFSMFLKTSHVSPRDGRGIFGLCII